MPELWETIGANEVLWRKGQNYPDIEAEGNELTEVDNPNAGQVTTVTTFDPVSYAQIALTVSAASRKDLREWGTFITELMAAINAQPQSPEVLGVLLTDAASNSKITPTEAAALQAILEAHTHRTTVTAPAKLKIGQSIFAKAGHGKVSASEIQNADQKSGGNGQYGHAVAA